MRNASILASAAPVSVSRWMTHAPWLLAALLLLAAARGAGLADEPAASRLEVVFFDVGQGDAALVKTPSGRHYLIDAGDDRFDAGSGVIVPYLKRHGIRRLDGVVMSHPHRDHIGGLPAVIEQIPIGAVIEAKLAEGVRWFPDPGDPAATAESIEESALYRRIVQALKDRKIPLVQVTTGQRLEWGPGLGVTVHNDGMDPSVLVESDDEESLHSNVNNMSVVVKVSLGQVAFLFTGDAERPAEKAMLERGEDLTSTVLKVGHHGSITSSTKGFLDAVSPRYALIGVGRNSFKHPNEKIVSDLRSRCERVLMTAADPDSARWETGPADGTIRCTSDGRNVRFETEHTQESLLEFLADADPVTARRERLLTALFAAIESQETGPVAGFLGRVESLPPAEAKALEPLLRGVSKRIRFQILASPREAPTSLHELAARVDALLK